MFAIFENLLKQDIDNYLFDCLSELVYFLRDLDGPRMINLLLENVQKLICAQMAIFDFGLIEDVIQEANWRR